MGKWDQLRNQHTSSESKSFEPTFRHFDIFESANFPNSIVIVQKSLNPIELVPEIGKIFDLIRELNTKSAMPTNIVFLYDLSAANNTNSTGISIHKFKNSISSALVGDLRIQRNPQEKLVFITVIEDAPMLVGFFATVLKPLLEKHLIIVKTLAQAEIHINEINIHNQIALGSSNEA